MHEECATESPTKKRSYAMRLFSGWMPQLDYVAIFGCLVRVGIRQGSVVYIKTVCFSFKTNHILRCLIFYQLRSLLRHKYHIRQSILFFHTNYCFIIQQTRKYRHLQRSVRLRAYLPRLCDCASEPRTDNSGRRLQGRDSRYSPARWLGVCEGTSRPLGPPTEGTVGR